MHDQTPAGLKNLHPFYPQTPTNGRKFRLAHFRHNVHNDLTITEMHSIPPRSDIEFRFERGWLHPYDAGRRLVGETPSNAGPALLWGKLHGDGALEFANRTGQAARRLGHYATAAMDTGKTFAGVSGSTENHFTASAGFTSSR